MIKMPFRDRYTNFWFNDISSETMKVWITNNRDLQFQLTPSFTDTFVAPVAARTRYHTATTFTSSDIQLKCIAIGVTMRDWRAIQSWLAPNRKGKLQLAFNDNTYYEVKIKQQIKGTFFVDGDLGHVEGDVYNIEFTVDFTTIGDWAAMGPQVVVPINNKFQDLEVVEALSSPNSTYPEFSQVTVKLIITYNDVLDNSKHWEDPEWWTTKLDENHSNYDLWKNGLDPTYKDEDGNTKYGETGSKMVANIILQAVANMNIATLSASINNKYYMPIVYNRTQSLNTALPRFSGTDNENQPIIINATTSVGRVYLTQPTVIHNKTIKLDVEYYNKIKKLNNSQNYFASQQYFLFDSAIEWIDDYDGEELDYTKLRGNYLGSITQETLVNQNNQAAMVLSNHPNEQDYDLVAKTIIDEDGITFYGVPVLFSASNPEAYSVCPFYYEEEENTYAVMNAGSYESYPDLYVNLGRTTNTTVWKNGEMLYDYHMSVKNTSLLFNGKTGFATFNNMLAEAATLSSGGGNTKVVSESTNNGMLTIESGNPELLKIRIFGMTESKFKRDEEGEPVVDPTGVQHIFFQPVGEFKYARNGQFAALLFKGVEKEQLYDSHSYPLINRNYLESSTYGSRVLDYSFTVNGFIQKVPVSKDINMWVLTMPKADITSQSLASPTLKENGALATPLYMYLSLCDYTEITVTSDTSAASYLMMQTRDAF